MFTSIHIESIYFQGDDGFSSFLPAPIQHQPASTHGHSQNFNGAASLTSTDIITGSHFTSGQNVNQFTAQQNRPPRQQQNSLDSLRNTGLSSAGQCGKRNAHGINGRVLQESQFQEGDTEFGKTSIFIVWDNPYLNSFVC